ncbi:MAG: hypothetical protein WCH11_00835 [Bdellovibrio sp.]
MSLENLAQDADINTKSLNDTQAFEFRCPNCERLYTSDFTQNEALFQCRSCQARFRVEKQSLSPTRWSARVETFALPQMKSLPRESRPCKACGALNPPALKECASCSVVFSKIQGFSWEEKKAGARPSLQKMWEELVRDFDNSWRHEEFVSECERGGALGFALQRYRDFKEAQPQDILAQRMYQKLFILNLRHSPAMQKVEYFFWKIHWSRVLRMSPVVLALFFILLGLFSQSQRNMIGFGSALLFLLFGFQYLTKGRVSLRDLWR